MAGMRSSGSIYPKSVVYLTTVSPPVYMALPVKSPYLKNTTVDIFFRWPNCVQHIQTSQNQSLIWQKFIPRRRPGDNVISRLFSKPDLAYCWSLKVGPVFERWNFPQSTTDWIGVIATISQMNQFHWMLYRDRTYDSTNFASFTWLSGWWI
jgi:hypothetical protein